MKTIKQVCWSAFLLFAFGIFIMACKSVEGPAANESTGIKGRVTDKKGIPIAGANVKISPSSKLDNTDKDGNFQFTGLTESNDYSVIVSKALYIMKTVSNVQVHNGAITALNNIELEPEPLKIEITPGSLTFAGSDKSK